VTFSPNEMMRYIRKIQQQFDEAQTYLEKYGFQQAKKGGLQDVKKYERNRKKQNASAPFVGIENKNIRKTRRESQDG